jgi:hypothetical protein
MIREYISWKVEAELVLRRFTDDTSGRDALSVL